MPHSYIFVDIDGPLLPGKMHLFPINQKITRAKLKEAEPMFDTFAVKAFNIWAKYADAKIIFSTNWATALYSYDEEGELEIGPEVRLKEIMLDNGLEFEGRYHEEILTPKKFTSERGSEIWWWLLDHAKDGDKFIAVDDDTSCRYIDDYIKRGREGSYVEVADFTGRWIDVDFAEGLTWENFHDGCKALGIEIDTINEGEFGIKPLTAEEKEEQAKALDMLIHCMV